MNHFMTGLHSNELKALVIADEIHQYYREGAPTEAAAALEDIVKTCRQRGLGVVMVTQSIKDLPEPLTQANRILMRISEGEIQMYGAKFGTDLARTLHNARPRTGHVHLFHETKIEEFWCHFRSTLSSPEGLSSYEEITKHSLPDKLKTQFREQQVSKVPQPAEAASTSSTTPTVASAIPELSEAELQFLDMLKNIGGTAKSELQIRIRLKWGQEKNRRIIRLLAEKKKIQLTETAGRIIIKLVDSSSHSSSSEKV
jgi:hypothetical protein